MHAPFSAFVLALLPLAPLAQQAPSAAADALQRWVADYAQGAAVERGALDGLVAAARTEAEQPDEGQAAALALLDLAGVVRSEARADLALGIHRPDADTESVRRAGIAALEALRAGPLGGDLLDRFATDVLVRRTSPLERRIAACDLMRASYRPSTMLALFTCATAPERGLRDAAFAALAGWQDASVQRFMTQQALRSASEPGWADPASMCAHFDAVSLGPDSVEGHELARALSLGALSPDWRTALRSVQLLGSLENELSIQPLIEALSVWISRKDRGTGSRRIEGQIVTALQHRSGKSIGAFPDRWSRWWSTARDAAPAAEVDDASAERTIEGFFGLRPTTDRVLFVIDRSGSMDNLFGTRGRSRYREALDQMKGLLTDLGPDTRFSVMLFGSGTQRWSRSLRPATKTALSTAVQWAIERGPAGGTNLRPAVEELFELRRDGTPDLEQLEVDTVIVLCDGATEEGPRWVAPFLARVNPQACLVFHCVQVGPGGDGTLETLAAETGGEFVRVR